MVVFELATPFYVGRCVLSESFLVLGHFIKSHVPTYLYLIIIDYTWINLEVIKPPLIRRVLSFSSIEVAGFCYLKIIFTCIDIQTVITFNPGPDRREIHMVFKRGQLITSSQKVINVMNVWEIILVCKL